MITHFCLAAVSLEQSIKGCQNKRACRSTARRLGLFVLLLGKTVAPYVQTMDQCEKGIAPVSQSAQDEYLPGYAELAAFISIDPDFQIYRRFDRLSARNLLYLQSELAELEHWFDQSDKEELERREKASDDEKVSIICRNQSWNAMVAFAEAGSKPNTTEDDQREAMKMKNIRRLREVTAEYRC
jgi:hypothetical protein